MGAEQKTVTVIGLGLMGSALARAFAGAGYELTVWNRTAEKANQLAGIARVAGTVREACAASTIIVVCVANYQVSDVLLQEPEVEASLSGKLLIQLSSGTPDDARQAEQWAKQRGIIYLDGAIMSYPQGIGDEHATILYAGPKAAFEANIGFLHILGGDARFRGEAIGGAAALDLALNELFSGTAAAILHSAAIYAAESLPLEDYFTEASGWLPGIFAASTSGVASGNYPSGSATMFTMAAFTRLLVRASGSSRIDATYPSALLSWIEKAIDHGHGADDIPSLYEAFRRP